MPAQRHPLAFSDAPRAATVLLLCLVILTTLMVLAFTFVRVLQLRHESNAIDNYQLLARQAARMGLAHATEQIMLDYANEPFTRMDGPAHAAFVTFNRPYESDYATDAALPGGTAVDQDDIPCENQMQLQFGPRFDWWQSLAYGMITADGRGRFYEPEFYDRAQVGYNLSATAPTVAVPFSQMMPLTTPLPDRSNGVFYDEQLNAIGGDPRSARTQSRYRLRYGVSVMDLDGELLVNGDQGLDPHAFTTADPRTAGLDPQVARIITHQHQLPAIIDAACENDSLSFNFGSGVTGGVRAEHIFINRGWASNFDQRPDTNNAPVTFPLMYRLKDGFFYWKNAEPGNMDPFALNDIAENLFQNTTPGVTGNPAGDEVIPPQPYPNNLSFRRCLVGSQFSFINYDRAVAGAATEGMYGLDGMADTLGRYTPFGRGMTKGALGRFSGNVDTPWQVNVMTAPSATVYGMIAGYMPPGAISDQHIVWERYTPQPPTPPPGTDRTSWVAPTFTSANLGARDLFVNALSPAFAEYPAASRAALAIVPDYHLPWIKPTDPAYSATRYPGPVIYNGNDASSTWQHDQLGIYLRSHVNGDAYTLFSGSIFYGPTNQLAGTMLPRANKVGNLINETHDGQRYSAFYWRNPQLGSGGNPGETQGPWIYVPTPEGNPPVIVQVPTLNDPGYDPAGNMDSFDSMQISPHKDSIWEVLGEAMGAAVAVARGQWEQYPTIISDPNTYFNNGPWTAAMGAKVASIQDVDALFVTNLGSSFTQPNSPTPVAAWSQNPGAFPVLQLQSFIPDFNLAALRTATITESFSATSCAVSYTANGVTSTFTGTATGAGTYTWPLLSINSGSTMAPAAGLPLPGPNPICPSCDNTKPAYTAEECSAAIELIINDMRLSFFGSSPGYANNFRALDLNGDGRANCSGFVANAAATPREIFLHLDQYTTSVDANGVATVPVDNYFSNTGVFMMGKSRFWRVMVRGELYDNVMMNAISGAQLDSVLCVDPVDAEQEFNPTGTADPGGGQYATHVIYQRWFFNKYRGLLPRRR